MKLDLTIGGYLPLDSMLHRLDPRTKIIGAFLMVVAVLVSPNISGVGMTLAAVCILATLTGAGRRVWLWSLSRFAWMLAIVFGINLLLRKEGIPIELGGWELPFTWNGLGESLVFTAQIAAAIILSMVLTLTTSPSELVRALEGLAKPLKRFNVPVDEAALIMVLAIRFLPLLQHELRVTIDAQKARGVEFDSGAAVVRARNLVAVLVPALTGAIRRSDQLATAMISRGFLPGRPRSTYKPLRLSRADFVAWILVSLFLLARLALSN